MHREILLPFRRLQLEVDQSPASVRERIRSKVRLTSALSAYSPEEPFWLTKEIWYQNAYTPFALLRVRSKNTGSGVQITFVPPGILLMLPLMGLMTYLMIVNRAGSFLIVALLLFLLIHVVCSTAFVYEADWIEQRMREALLTDGAKA